MGILTRAGDLVYTFRFLKLLTTKFEDTEAFKLGIIDGSGKRDKSVRVDTSEKKSAYTSFHRLVFNIKRLMEKVPGGGTTLASYASALYLIKEKYGVSEDKLSELLMDRGIDTLMALDENTEWFIIDNDKLAAGTYKLRAEKVAESTFESIAVVGDVVIVEQSTAPAGQMFGLNIYKVKHKKTNQNLFVTPSELFR